MCIRDSDEAAGLIEFAATEHLPGGHEFLAKLRPVFGFVAHSSLFLFGGHGALTSGSFTGEHVNRETETKDESSENSGESGKGSAVSANQFLKAIHAAGRAGEDRFVMEMALDVGRERVRSFVATSAILFD